MQEGHERRAPVEQTRGREAIELDDESTDPWTTKIWRRDDSIVEIMGDEKPGEIFCILRH
jgi:hypothetical protein